MKSKVKRSAKAQSDSFKHQDLKPFTKRLAEHNGRTGTDRSKPENCKLTTSKNPIWIIF